MTVFLQQQKSYGNKVSGSVGVRRRGSKKSPMDSDGGHSDFHALQVLNVLMATLTRSGIPGQPLLSFTIPKKSTDPKGSYIINRFIDNYGKAFGMERVAKEPNKVSLGGPSAYDAIFFFRAYFEVLADFDSKVLGFDLADQFVIYEQARHWPQEYFIKYAKYCTAFPMAKYMRRKCSLTELPPCPPEFDKLGAPLFSGPIRRFLRARCYTQSTKNAELMQSILQGVKRGCAPVSEEFVVKAMEDHREVLSSEPRGESPTVEHIDFYHSLFSGFELSNPKLHEPSTAASWQNTRGGGGSREWIRYHHDSLYPYGDDGPDGRENFAPVSDMSSWIETLNEVQPRGFWGTYLMNKVQLVNGFRKNKIEVTRESPVIQKLRSKIEQRLKDDPYISPNQPRNGKPLHWLDTSDVCDQGLLKIVETHPGRTREIRGKPPPSVGEIARVAALTNNRRPAVMVSAVLEPLKVRLITKGDSYRYWYSRFLQKAIAKHLHRGFPQMDLIGGPLNTGHLEWLRNVTDACHPEFDLWVSGDYSAATDGLDIRHTKACFEALIKQSCIKDKRNLTQQWDLLRSVLYEQELHYPTKSGVPNAMQKTGQLMGSTLSFPILCAVNLCGYYMALNRYRKARGLKPLALDQLPVLVNGDDILFRTNKELYGYWKEEIQKLGFRLSVGKNYVHPSLLTVNSVMFREERPGQFKELRYLNVGLLTGMSRVTGRTTVRTLPLWDIYNETVPNSVNPVRAHRRFVHYHKKKINDLTLNGKYNLFLPFELGGLGFKIPEGLDFNVTNFQRQWAYFCKTQFFLKPEKAHKVALVQQKARPDMLTYHTCPNFVIRKKGWDDYTCIGPLERGFLRKPIDPTIENGLLADPMYDHVKCVSSGEFKIRHPSKAFVKKWNLSKKRLIRPRSLFSFPWKAYQIRREEIEKDHKIGATDEAFNCQDCQPNPTFSTDPEMQLHPGL